MLTSVSSKIKHSVKAPLGGRAILFSSGKGYSPWIQKTISTARPGVGMFYQSRKGSGGCFSRCLGVTFGAYPGKGSSFILVMAI